MKRLALLAATLPLLGTPAAAEGTTSLGPTAQQRLNDLTKQTEDLQTRQQQQTCREARQRIASIPLVCLKSAATNNLQVWSFRRGKQYVGCTLEQTAAIDTERACNNKDNAQTVTSPNR